MASSVQHFTIVYQIDFICLSQLNKTYFIMHVHCEVLLKNIYIVKKYKFQLSSVQ